jgi:hypothetical protein
MLPRLSVTTSRTRRRLEVAARYMISEPWLTRNRRQLWERCADPRDGPVSATHGFPQQGSQRRAKWGHSSVGRALEWHSRGRGFDSPWLHQRSERGCDEIESPLLRLAHSSRASTPPLGLHRKRRGWPDKPRAQDGLTSAKPIDGHFARHALD